MMPSATQMAERVATTPDGPVPTGISRIEFVVGSTLIRRLDDSLTIQTAPCPVAIAVGRPRRPIVPLTAAATGSMREILAWTPFATQREPKSRAIASSPPPPGICDVHVFVLG